MSGIVPSRWRFARRGTTDSSCSLAERVPDRPTEVRLEAVSETTSAAETRERRRVASDSEHAQYRLSLVEDALARYGAFSDRPAPAWGGVRGPVSEWVTPTRAGEAAETILDLVDADASGPFHVAWSCVTPDEFGEVIAETLDASPSLEEVPPG